MPVFKVVVFTYSFEQEIMLVFYDKGNMRFIKCLSVSKIDKTSRQTDRENVRLVRNNLVLRMYHEFQIANKCFFNEMPIFYVLRDKDWSDYFLECS